MENNYNKKTGGAVRHGSSDGPSWAGVIICLFIFWPLGLLLLVGKIRSNANQSGTSNRRYQTGARSEPAGSRAAPERAAKKKVKHPDRKVSGLLLVLGLALLAVCAALFIPVLPEIVRAGGFSGLANSTGAAAVTGVFFGVGGVLTLFARGRWRRRMSKFRKYAAAIGGRDTMAISAIVSATGFSVKAVRRDLQAMIDSGWFDAASYIDDGLGCFALTSEAAQALRREAESSASSAVSASSGEDSYMRIIAELRALNEGIIDISISDKIDRIEAITAKIFRTVEDDPAKLPQIRRFMSYYLPTTLKLLHSYATLEKQGEHGENISAAKASIDGILDTLAAGFEQQLDKLFKSDAIDITSDISVLEKMMARDGLTGENPLAQALADRRA